MGRYTGKTCRLIFMLVITVVFFVAEIVAGYVGNSIALVSDSFNMLSDILSLCVGLTAARVSRRAGSGRSTYGLGRAEVVGALANAVFLAALCFSICVEAIKRLVRPEPISDPFVVLIVGALGLAVNVVGLFIFQDCSWLCASRNRAKNRAENGEAGSPAHEQDTPQKDKSDGPPLNIRGVLLHVLNDALGSVVVVVASVIFYVLPLAEDQPCNWQCYVDPSLTLVMVAIIMSSAVPLVKETTSILMQMAPPDMPLTSIVEAVSKLPGVLSIHEVHMWELAKDRNVATLHVKVSSDHYSTPTFSGVATLHAQIREVFHKAGVHSVTIQMEFGSGDLESNHCSTPCVSPDCLKSSCCPISPKIATNHKAYQAPPTRETAIDMADTTKNLLKNADTKDLGEKCYESTGF